MTLFFIINVILYIYIIFKGILKIYYNYILYYHSIYYAKLSLLKHLSLMQHFTSDWNNVGRSQRDDRDTDQAGAEHQLRNELHRHKHQ